MSSSNVVVCTLYRSLSRQARQIWRHVQANESLRRAVVAGKANREEPLLAFEQTLISEVRAHSNSRNPVVAALRNQFDKEVESPAALSERIDEGFSGLRQGGELLQFIALLKEAGNFRPSLRPQGLAYACGEVLQHKLFGRCVVCGWDESCAASEEWIQGNGIDRVLKWGRNQPFYSVLCEDGTARYCSQENLSLDPSPVPFDNEDLQHYFTGYEGGVYMPVPELLAHFPEDHPSRQAPGTPAASQAFDGSVEGSMGGSSEAGGAEDGSAGDPDAQASVVDKIANADEAGLVDLLKVNDPVVASFATSRLWKFWHGECGKEAQLKLEEGTKLMEEKDYSSAQQVFQALTQEHPKWAEALNKQAILAYLESDFAMSVSLCKKVLELKPHHFGALDGLGMSAIQLSDWQTATEAAQQLRKVVPHSKQPVRLLSLIERERHSRADDSEDELV